ncbi:hypothetical protein RSOLAG22IIIB_07816 [Rhizoctonia solani]|uniref:Uncharacterized protein n=1 Tax=Rhizoctonia solani TaxID=456999 RepID=A0A0K6FQ15_9AGAM|nr:hypothetical protein RSOLAG22IIIB_07816 [Rhizoctonia solani]
MIYYGSFQQAARAAMRFVATHYAPQNNLTSEQRIKAELAATRNHGAVPLGDITQALGGKLLQKYKSDMGPLEGRISGLAIPEKQYLLRIDYKPVKGYEGFKRPANPTPAEIKRYKSFMEEVKKGGYGIHFNARNILAGTISDHPYPKFAAYIAIVDQYPADLEAEFKNYSDPIQKVGVTIQTIRDQWRQGLLVK